MSTVQKCVFDLPADHVAFTDDQIASGAFASKSDVVREGLRALQERDAPLGRWLRDVVGPTCDVRLADPSRAVLAQAVFDEIRARHAASHTREDADRARRHSR